MRIYFNHAIMHRCVPFNECAKEANLNGQTIGDIFGIFDVNGGSGSDLFKGKWYGQIKKNIPSFIANFSGKCALLLRRRETCESNLLQK